MKIIIPDDYQNVLHQLECRHLLKDHDLSNLHSYYKNTEELAAQCWEADVLVLIRERTKITESLLSKLPNLKLISQTGKISRHIDLDACTKHKVAVIEGTGSPIAPAELCWALIMNAWRQIPQAMDGMKKGQWQTNIGRTLYGQNIGIWGYGKIGRKIAAYARAFEMNVIIWGSNTSRNKAIEDGFTAASSKEEFFTQSDIVTLHLRLTDSTDGIVLKKDLDLMKPDSLLVNTSRAELIEKGALWSAISSGKPGFLALDVYENEPVFDVKFPYLLLPNAICTPHLGYAEKKSLELYFSQAFQNVLDFVQGNNVHILNPGSIQR
jgi:D-3-phosphoglycerate dehydrogenase